MIDDGDFRTTEHGWPLIGLKIGIAVDADLGIAGLAEPLEVTMDIDLLDFSEVWAAGGTPTHVFPIGPDELLSVTNATLASVSE